MVRRSSRSSGTKPRFPHARGDGPSGRRVRRVPGRFSPRAWGWSAWRSPRAIAAPVFPTRVGMVQAQTEAKKKKSKFSPRAWGWSDRIPIGGGSLPVFPTRVGMVRILLCRCRARGCFPHARGDGPSNRFRITRGPMFSPRAWGWSGHVSAVAGVPVVFPTRVGMVRPHAISASRVGSFPHARGDGPNEARWIERAVRFSPRAWGWSALDDQIGRRGRVFPTRVGMVRCSNDRRSDRKSFPHAAWGWSDHEGTGAVRYRDFLAPVSTEALAWAIIA